MCKKHDREMKFNEDLEMEKARNGEQWSSHKGVVTEGKRAFRIRAQMSEKKN